ncbi:MAG TPA: diaminopimelate decarboxylase [Solirubrobacterales bacterium]|jgi:diaminopimelate decarboxylase|nr:diaminopimelate decarboxylase [Solirubrobacterales bacterium]
MSEPGQAGAIVDSIADSAVFPAGSRVDDRGRLEVAGCDVIELAEEFGTPAYVYAEDDMRARARAYREAFERRTDDFEVLFASKAFPCTAAYRLFAEEGLSVDVASGGELHMALRAGFDPARIHMHGNNKSDEEILLAARAGVGHLILDSFDEIERCERLLEGPQKVLIRVTPGIKPSTHDYVQTGQLDSKFGFGLEDGLAAKAIERVLGSERLDLVGLHAHIGSQIFELEPYRLAIEAIGALAGEWCRVVNVGGGLGIAYTAEDRPPPIDAYVDVKVRGVAEAFGEGVRILVEPGRSLVGNAGVTLYRVGTVKEIPGVRTYVAVDGGMSDNLRPILYGSRYEALIADRAGAAPDTLATIAGMHCESGDVIVRDTMLAAPSVGDVLVTPATGAYGYAMASNYNGVPRPPVVFCRNGEARAVVRRETYEDLTARDLDA